LVQAIFHHKTESVYNDVIGQQYHFPKRYLSRIEKTIDDWIIYYGAIPGKKSRYYSGIARVRSVRPDPAKPGHHYAYLSDYLDFDRLWFGILFLVSAQMAYISPPFGYTLFYMKGVLPAGIGMGTVYRAIIPFMLLQALGILICAIFPELVLWLPHSMIK